MNTCKKCNISLDSDITFCPLCGNHVKRAIKVKNCNAYAKIDLKSVSSFRLIRLINLLLLSGVIVCCIIAIPLKISNFHIGDWWLVYVLVSAVFIKFNILDMIERRFFGWYDIFKITIFSMIYLIFIDWYTLKFVGFSIAIVIPTFLLFAMLMINIMIFYKLLSPYAAMQTTFIIFGASVIIMMANIILKVIGFQIEPYVSIVSAIFVFGNTLILLPGHIKTLKTLFSKR